MTEDQSFGCAATRRVRLSAGLLAGGLWSGNLCATSTATAFGDRSSNEWRARGRWPGPPSASRLAGTPKTDPAPCRTNKLTRCGAADSFDPLIGLLDDPRTPQVPMPAACGVAPSFIPRGACEFPPLLPPGAEPTSAGVRQSLASPCPGKAGPTESSRDRTSPRRNSRTRSVGTHPATYLDST